MSSSSSSSGVNNLENFLIPLEEINRATQNFSSDYQIGKGLYTTVYIGQLSERWQNRYAAIKHRDVEGSHYHGKDEFLKELELISSFQHENIIPFIGYCDEGDKMIIVTQYAINGSLHDLLFDQDKKRSLEWARRLKICLGVAIGLEYLHSSHGECKGGKVIQREPNSGNILLDENMEAKLCGFGNSILIPRNQPHVYDSYIVGTIEYIDPVYSGSSIVNSKTDTYAFGIVLFEMLSGMLAYQTKSLEDTINRQRLIKWVRRYSDVGFEKLIDPDIRDEIDRISLNMVKEVAYKCISFNLKERPTIDVIIKTIDRALNIHNHGATSIVAPKSLQHIQSPDFFRIPLEEIKRATQNFSLETGITSSDYNAAYRGQLSESWQNRNAAIKCRDVGSQQQRDAFLNELELISSFDHENIIPFIGYCNEDNVMIIVSDHAVNGTLNYHLQFPSTRRSLTWAQRLKICLGVATGLKYLHSGLGQRGIVIQKDLKSATILLDDNMEAKICNFGRSILIPRNKQHIYDPAARGGN